MKEVHLLGRRGPVQAAFTPKELRELLGLKGVKVRARQGKVCGHIFIERALASRVGGQLGCVLSLVQLFWVLIQCV